MNNIAGPFVGGLLAVAGGILVAFTADIRERRRSRRDAQLRASVRLLTSLQTLIRRMIDLAYLDDKRGSEQSATVFGRYHYATVEWNAAMYEALLVSPPKLAAVIPPLDREVDRLLDLAMSRQWTRIEFRVERITVGRMAAQFLGAARNHANLSPIGLSSVWAWHDEVEALPEVQSSP